MKIFCTRNFNVIHELKAKDYVTGVNWARASFSPDGRYVCAGSSDGSLFVWNVNSGSLETELQLEWTTRDSNTGVGVTVTCCLWNPNGSSVATCDRAGYLTFWG